MEGDSMTAEMQESFWAAVRECLVRFHDFPDIEAVRTVAEFRSRLEEAPPGVPLDMVYHAEPFDVACDLADHEIDRAEVEAEYMDLLQRTAKHAWRVPLVGEPVVPAARRLG
jgi:hypothetical protein